MNIDLNIQNYTNDELIQLFHLPSEYTMDDLEQSENEMYLQLMKMVNDISTKQKITLFLKQAKERLIPIQPIPFIPKQYILTIDSTTRGQYNLTKPYDYLFTFYEPIMAASIQIVSIDMYAIWNTITTTNNLFYINQDLIPIPEGHYTNDEMVNVLTPLIPIDVCIKTHTKFTSSESFTLDFSSKLKLFYKSAGWYMGFRREKYTSVYNAIESIYEVISEAPYGHITEQVSVELHDFHETFDSDEYSMIRQEVNSFQYGKYIMAKFSVFDKNISVHNFPIRTYHSPVKLERFRLRLLNKYGELFPLLTDYSITIKINSII